MDELVYDLPQHLVESLTCPICFKILSHPCAIGPCNHTFCRTCLLAWADARIAQDLEDADDDDEEYTLLCQGTPLCCPVCRRVGLPATAFAHSYQVNQPMNAALVALAQQQHSCTVVQCELHPGRPLELYCTDCNQPSCSHCGLFGRHRGHQLLEVNEALLTELDTQIERSREEITAWAKRRVAFHQARRPGDEGESEAVAAWAKAAKAAKEGLARQYEQYEEGLARHGTVKPRMEEDDEEDEQALLSERCALRARAPLKPVPPYPAATAAAAATKCAAHDETTTDRKSSRTRCAESRESC